MKRGILGIFLLVFLFGISLLEAISAARQLRPIEDQLAEASQTALREDTEKTADLTGTARSAWGDYRLKFSCFSQQDAVREIDSLFAQADVFLRSGEMVHCSAACIELKNQLQALLEDQIPNLPSLL